MSSQKPSWIGRTLAGRYKIEKLLGQGGMSAVYRGTDPNLRRTVAIKLIHPHLASDQDFVRRFEEEAAAVASLRHANIIQVFDFSHDGDTYYMVLEYLPGESLDQRLIRLNNRGEQMAVEKAASFMLALCNAVGYAHDQGMVHRDLKPANVMISPKEEVVLMDFGIAKIMGGESHTATGALVGTIVYMSPEQIRGEPAGPSADIYALGIILYEMVTGRRPFQGENTAATMMAHLNEPIPDARQYVPNTPAEIIHIIERALAKSPAKRYQTAHEMAAELRACLGLSSQIQSGLLSSASQAPPRHPGTQVAEPESFPVRPDSGVTQVDPSVRGAAAQVGQQGASQISSGVKQSDSAIRQGAGRGTRFLSGLGLLFLILIIGGCAGIFFLSSQMSLFGDEATATPDAVAAATNTSEPTATTEPPTATATTAIDIEPTAETDEPPPAQATNDVVVITTPVPIDPNTPTPSPRPFQGVRLTNVEVRDSSFVVLYDLVGYAQIPTGIHLHFYFNNIEEFDAGVPGRGPYIEHDGAPPFITAVPENIPLGVTQICAVIAGRLHQVRPGTSSCIDLP